MKMWMFNCRDVSRLVSESMDRELSFTKRMGVRFHLMMCRHCAGFRHQLARIRKIIRSQDEENIPPLTMEGKARERLNQLLKEKINSFDPETK
ncbi:MAG: zf-HC2 domain-containing protein [Desulforhopalus sp.]|jgi:predicted anti-sigma-YlaC factor YlaD|nr:zf-HC2 domain-containing protein [Desulforhopalus sp.]